jgi:ABC-type glutathione transport system ATPase component
MEGRDDVLSVRDLEIGYSTGRGLVRAVRRVSFDLGHDESLAFIGESGSGKTTLGLSLVRLLPQNASRDRLPSRPGRGVEPDDPQRRGSQALPLG